MIIARTARAAFTKNSPVRIGLYYFEKCSSPAADVSALFCFNQCDPGPNVNFGDEALSTSAWLKMPPKRSEKQCLSTIKSTNFCFCVPKWEIVFFIFIFL